ncbi:MAG: hypothetical protein ABSH41_02515 [Syntrophobacteraceae bacterium]|jgi:lysophospholipase L1-like esterase
MKLESGRKLIIYGAGARGIVLHQALKILGRKTSYFIDARAEKEDGLYCCGLPVHEPIKLLYENVEDIFVVIAAASPSEMIDTLKGLGLKPGEQFGCIFDSSLDDGTVHSACSNRLDFFLGYGRSSDIPGFECLRKDSTSSEGQKLTVNILTLGGSTTDPQVMDPLEWNDEALRDEGLGSWPRHLHELLNAHGIDNCIYNGGLGGYCSAQELLKLLRDGLSMHPDIVIVVDGLNDGNSMYYHKNRYPKYHSHFAAIEDIVRPLLSNQNETHSVLTDITYGLESGNTSWQEWYENQRIMNSICKEFGIEHLSFLQPYGSYDNNYLLSCESEFRTHWLLHNFFQSRGMKIRELANADSLNLNMILYEYSCDVFSPETDYRRHFSLRHREIEEFYSYALNHARGSNFIVPIIDTYYGYPDIFCDNVHCTTKGNMLIAERIHRELINGGVLTRAIDGKAGGKQHNEYLRQR